MPTEIRRLVFTEVETARAISELSLNTPTTMPAGAVLDYKVEQESPVRLRLHLQTREGKQLYHTIDEAFVAAALISFCMRGTIPIAKKSRKTVKVVKGGVALDMTLEGA